VKQAFWWPTAQPANNQLKVKRDFFLLDYPIMKEDAIRNSDEFNKRGKPNSDVIELDELSTALLEEARDYAGHMTAFFGNDFEPTDKNVLRAQVGFDFLKFLMVENFSMFLEAFLVDVYAHPERTNCTQEAAKSPHRLGDRANTAKLQLEKTFQMLLEHRIGGEVISLKCGFMTPRWDLRCVTASPLIIR
jgi:hypothetical protein